MGAMDKKKVFEILSPGKRAPRDYQFAPLHMVFDVNDDGTHKGRFVAGGHVVDSTHLAAYASVMKSSNLRILLTIAAKFDLEIYTGDVGGAYLNANTREMSIRVVVPNSLRGKPPNRRTIKVLIWN